MSSVSKAADEAALMSLVIEAMNTGNLNDETCRILDDWEQELDAKSGVNWDRRIQREAD